MRKPEYRRLKPKRTQPLLAGRKRSLLLLFLSLLLVAVISAGGTLAYYTGNAGEQNNVLAFEENIRARLDEYNWDADAGLTMVPGKELRKDPMITNTGRLEEYVAIKLTFQDADQAATLSQSDYERLLGLITIDWNTGTGAGQWTLVSGGGTPEQVFVYNQALSPGEVTDPLFNTVRIHTKLDTEEPMTEADLRWLQGIKYENGQPVTDETALGGFNIQVEGAAVQADTLSAPTEAYQLLLALFS